MAIAIIALMLMQFYVVLRADRNLLSNLEQKNRRMNETGDLDDEEESESEMQESSSSGNDGRK